ncbi:NADPH-dependent FMN reductase [Nocardioides coralli]|uniref:NADPH-dependent FMN reductase n=1 Tax=Nocardioides coralli TaxID=2872154 RepID=UPI001CA4556E|nr:NAD(P)H-dependent oxidoreductase [Nocardioides coralli]QZY28696.1 NAD(P)H-dependent oxidoreductase [Nocardioides coralli]
MKIGIVLGSTRPGRLGTGVAEWVAKQAADRDGTTYDLLDVADFDLDLLGEPVVPGAANRQYENPRTQRWSETVDDYDGFVFVTPEYNHGVPAALKNAFDVLGPEWRQKAIGFVAYGADGGVRAVEHWRTITANMAMLDARNQLALSLFTDFGDHGFVPSERREGELGVLLDELESLTEAAAGLRAA